MLDQVKAQKGKAFEKLPKKSLEEFNDKRYLQSIKYDGNQIFIVKIGKVVNFYTSDWKPFHLEVVASELKDELTDFMLVGEFMHGCKGKLGDRRKSAILTTYRTNFAKGIANTGIGQMDTNIMVFDALEIKQEALITNIPYYRRVEYATSLTEGLKYLSPVVTQEVFGHQTIELSRAIINRGWEGTMLVEADSHYHIGKRVNHSIKLKSRPTADLECIGIELGEGKYEGMIGSLTLRDSEGRIVNVGSGLDDRDRQYNEDYFISKIIEIEYEQIMETYIQPTYIRIRDDKEKGE